MSATNDERLARFKQLLTDYHASPTDYDEGEEEDPRPYFTGEEQLCRYVCVTVNYSSHGEAKYFFLPTFDDPAAAMDRAVEYARDDLFEELPVEVHDLDGGPSYTPSWHAVPWSIEGEPVQPEPPEELADAWRRFQAGEDVTPQELRDLDEWRADAREDALGW